MSETSLFLSCVSHHVQVLGAAHLRKTYQNTNELISYIQSTRHQVRRFERGDFHEVSNSQIVELYRKFYSRYNEQVLSEEWWFKHIYQLLNQKQKNTIFMIIGHVYNDAMGWEKKQLKYNPGEMW